MNIIVTNKYKDLLYSTNIEILKELHGVFKIREIVNSFNSIFYKKIIIDATAIEGFPKEDVLKELVSSFDTDKLILFLPPDNPPPKKFLSFLISIKLYNFTDNPKGLLQLIRRSNTFDDVKGFQSVVEEKIINPEENENLYSNTDAPGRIVLGVIGVTEEAFTTEMVYSIKRTLEEKYNKNVQAVELDKKNLSYYNTTETYSIFKDRFNEYLKNNLSPEIIVVDLGEFETNLCDDIMYLVNPSLYTVNKLLYKSRDAFIKLKGKKVIFVNSLLSNDDVNQFAKEAGISVYYNLAPINDRVFNNEIDKLLMKLGVVPETNSKPAKKGLFDIFK